MNNNLKEIFDNIKLKTNKNKIWDIIRKKWIIIKPEEIVRQKIVYYLIHFKKYPQNLIAVEKEFKFNNKKKRFDILVYNEYIKPHILVECKNSSIDLNDNNLNQLIAYNITLNPNYIIITNIEKTFFFKREINKVFLIEDLPNYIVN